MTNVGKNLWQKIADGLGSLTCNRTRRNFQDNRGAGACYDPFVLTTFLTGPGGIENNFFNPGVRQREQIVNMPVVLLGPGAVSSKTCSQSFHRAAGVDVSPGGKDCFS
jgi:hypothetical protein